MDFPGGKVSFVAEMNFLPGSQRERINCYRVLNDDGTTISGSRFQEVLATHQSSLHELSS